MVRAYSEFFGEAGEVFGRVDVVMWLPFVHGEDEIAGSLDGLAVDGLDRPANILEEPFVRLSQTDKDIIAVGTTDDRCVVATIERMGGADDTTGRQGRGVGAEDEDGLGTFLEEPGHRGKHPLAKVPSGLRHEPHAFVREELSQEGQAPGRGTGDHNGAKAQSARFLERVANEGGLEMAACRGGRRSRVFTVPGTGALAMTSRRVRGGSSFRSARRRGPYRSRRVARGLRPGRRLSA